MDDLEMTDHPNVVDAGDDVSSSTEYDNSYSHSHESSSGEDDADGDSGTSSSSSVQDVSGGSSNGVVDEIRNGKETDEVSNEFDTSSGVSADSEGNLLPPNDNSDDKGPPTVAFDDSVDNDETSDGVSSDESDDPVLTVTYLKTGGAHHKRLSNRHLTFDDTPADLRTLKRSKSKKQAVKDTAVGLSALFGSPRATHHEVPEGYQLQYDKVTGRRFVIPIGEKSNWDLSERRKWVHTKFDLRLMAPMEQIRRAFGTGIFLYFSFIKFTAMTNLFLGVLSLFSLIPHFAYDGWKSSNGTLRSQAENFFVSSYGEESYYWWLVTNILMVLSMVAFAPLLSYNISRIFQKLGIEDNEDNWKEQKTSGLEVVLDHEGNPKYPEGIIKWRYALSYIVFILVLVASFIINIVLNVTQLSLGTNDYIFLIVITLVLVTTNWLFWKLCLALTMLEGHRTWTMLRRHQIVKFFVFRCLILSLVFLSRFLARIYFPWFSENISFLRDLAGEDAEFLSQSCTVVLDSEQFAVLLFVDLTVVRFGSNFFPWVLYWIWQWRHPGLASKHSDRGRPHFDIAEEYLELLYRQYVVFLGISICPPLALIAFVGNVMEYPIDKFQLVNLTKVPPRLDGSMKSFLFMFMLATAMLALVMFPNGFVWVLTGFVYKDPCVGSLFDQTLGGLDQSINSTLIAPSFST